MQPLKIDVSHYGTNDELVNNIKYALSLGLPELQLPPCRHDGTFVVVGSGPSVTTQLLSIKAEQDEGRPICAINGAHDLLLENDITPDLFVTTDPRPMPNNLDHHNEKTLYMLASRVNPETLDLLKGRNILLWHAWGDKENTDAALKDKMAIGGGTTSGLRAINIAYVLGFRKVNMYGLDSCLNEDKWKRFDSGVVDKMVKTIDVIVGGRRFICNMAMAQQAEDFQGIYDVMPDVSIQVFGGGLISAIIDERKKKGLKT